MKIEEKNVCKFRSILNTFSIDENFKKKKKKKKKKAGGRFWSRIAENKKLRGSEKGSEGQTKLECLTLPWKMS